LYLDANVLVYAAMDNTARGHMARELLSKIGPGRCQAEVSTLVMDEVLWAIQKRRGRAAAEAFGRLMLGMPFTWLDAGNDSAKAAIDYYHDGLDPRDSFHAGIMHAHGLQEIASEDSHFDGSRHIRRRSIMEALTEIR
jgi:predicted nucleic acid-binding protein